MIQNHSVIRIALIAALCLFAAAAFGQTPQPTTNFASVGASSDGAKTAFTALYARLISDSGTYAFSVLDAVPTSVRPVNVVTSFSAGIAQRALTIGKAEVFVPTSAGISYSGSATGWQWSTGALIAIPIKQSRWRIAPNVRVLKSSVDPAGYRLIGGVMFGSGW
jgi:hypothetical protein